MSRWGLVVSAFLLSTPAWALPSSLRILSGMVEVQKSQSGIWTSAPTESTVEQGDKIRTAKGSRAFLIFPDDHRVAIGEESVLSLDETQHGKTKIFLKSGTVRNKVQHLKPAEYYKIQTPSAVCAVRGTDFLVNVSHIENQAQVVLNVFEGRVAIQSTLQRDVMREVTANQAVSVQSTGKITLPAPMTAPAPGGAPAATSGSTSAAPKKEDGSSQNKNTHQGPPPPGSGGPGNGPAVGPSDWYNHPEHLNSTDFNSFDPSKMPGMPGDHSDMKGPPAGTTEQQRQAFYREQYPMFAQGEGGWNGGPAGTYNGATYNGTNNYQTYGPLPTGSGGGSGSGTTSTTGASVAGNDALISTIQTQNLQDKLGGILVAGLFQDGGVKLGWDGAYHQYADAVVQNGSNGIKFQNATMTAGHPETLNYQILSLTFNTNLPSDYTQATRTAFLSDIQSALSAVPQTYYATTVDNFRTNTVDTVEVVSSGGAPSLLSTGVSTARYQVAFTNETSTVNGTTLYQKRGSVTTYLGGAAPTVSASGSGSSAGISDRYSTGDYLGRNVVFIDGSGQAVTTSNVPAGTTASSYLSGLTVQDTLYSNLFTHGPIVMFGTALSRLYGGVDAVLNDTDANSILTGHMPQGAPDGIVR